MHYATPPMSLGNMRAIGTAFFLATMLTTAGCGTQPPSSTSLKYVRTDGRPVDTGPARAVLAMCRDEGVMAIQDIAIAGGPYVIAMMDRPKKKAEVTNACMARNGYILVQ
jgi:hypothetical protein